jgi:hypothetical protein
MATKVCEYYLTQLVRKLGAKIAAFISILDVGTAHIANRRVADVIC